MPMFLQASAMIGEAVENPHTDRKAGDAGPHYRAADEAPRQPSGLVSTFGELRSGVDGNSEGKIEESRPGRGRGDLNGHDVFIGGPPAIGRRNENVGRPSADCRTGQTSSCS